MSLDPLSLPEPLELHAGCAPFTPHGNPDLTPFFHSLQNRTLTRSRPPETPSQTMMPHSKWFGKAFLTTFTTLNRSQSSPIPKPARSWTNLRFPKFSWWRSMPPLSDHLYPARSPGMGQRFFMVLSLLATVPPKHPEITYVFIPPIHNPWLTLSYLHSQSPLLSKKMPKWTKCR